MKTKYRFVYWTYHLFAYLFVCAVATYPRSQTVKRVEESYGVLSEANASGAAPAAGAHSDFGSRSVEMSTS